MKRFLIITTLIILGFNINHAQELVLERVYGLVKDDIFFETIELSDGNYLSLGWTYSLGNGETDFFLVKTRPNGNILWTKTFGGYEKETGISVKEFSNGNLLLSGTTRSFGNGAGDCIFIITDKLGNRLNEFYYGSLGEDYLRESIITDDNNIVFTGFTDSFGNGSKDIILGKIDTNGNLKWVKNFGSTKNDEGWSVKETSNSSFIISGFSTGTNLKQYSITIKTDLNGIQTWDFKQEQAFTPYGINSCSVEDPNGNFIIASTLNSNGKDVLQITKLSSSGDIIDSKSFNNDFNIEVRWICQTSNGYAISGSLRNANSKSDIIIIFLDKNLNEINTITIDKGGEDNGWKVNSYNNKVILSGSITNHERGDLDGIFSVFEFKSSYQDSITCINIPIIEDAAIGFHDYFDTSDQNYKDAIQLAAYTIPGALGGVNKNRAIFRFDIPQILDNVNIISAKLNLFAIGSLGSLDGHTGSQNQGIIQKVIQPWSLDNVTWDNQPNTTKQNEIILDKSQYPTQDYLGLDITSLFQDLQIENLGLMLKQVNETTTNALLFCSSDYSNINKRPSVDVCYHNNVSDAIDVQQCDVSYYPNPSNNYLYIDFEKNSFYKENKYYVYSINGQFINKYDLTFPKTTLDLDQFTPGLYVVVLPENICSKTFKFVVIKD